MSLSRLKEVFQRELLNMSNARRIEDPPRKYGSYSFVSPKTSLEGTDNTTPISCVNDILGQ